LQFAKKEQFKRTPDFSETKETPTVFYRHERHMACKGGGIARVKNRNQKNNQMESRSNFLLFRLHQNIVSARKIISDRVISAGPKGSKGNPPARGIPIHFPTDLSHALEIKIQ
jgi:hypothetical protein